MLIITMQVNAPVGYADAVKETLAHYCERFGDTRIVNIEEVLPQQMGMDGFGQSHAAQAQNNRGR